MNRKLFSLLVLFSFVSLGLQAQKPFTEGTIVYNVNVESPDKDIQTTGTYTFTIKGKQIRKELKMNNGYEDILICNSNAHTAYSLQKKADKKYAIQLDIDDIENKQNKYLGFKISGKGKDKKIAGYLAQKGQIAYNDGNTYVLYYSDELYPGDENMYDRFPGIKVMPLSFYYKDDKGMVMNFYAEKIKVEPIENVVFSIPSDYKIISHSEYMQMNK